MPLKAINQELSRHESNSQQAIINSFLSEMNGFKSGKYYLLSKPQGMVKDREAWGAAVHGGRKESDVTERLNNK